MFTFIGSMDYVPVSQVLTFERERRTCMNVPIIDDNSLEINEESFKVTLTRTEGLDERIQLTTDEGQVTIRENDGMYYVLYSSDCIPSVKNCFFLLFSRVCYCGSGEEGIHCL